MKARKVGDHVEVDEEEARAGQTGLHVRYILLWSTLAVAVALGLAAAATMLW